MSANEKEKKKNRSDENRICFDAESECNGFTHVSPPNSSLFMYMDLRQQALVEFFSILLYLLTPATTEKKKRSLDWIELGDTSTRIDR